MSMESVRKYYNVPAKRGMKILYTGDKQAKIGRIRSAYGSSLVVSFDGTKRRYKLHPTWEVKYFDTPESEKKMIYLQTLKR